MYTFNKIDKTFLNHCSSPPVILLILANMKSYIKVVRVLHLCYYANRRWDASCNNSKSEWVCSMLQWLISLFRIENRAHVTLRDSNTSSLMLASEKVLLEIFDLLIENVANTDQQNTA